MAWDKVMSWAVPLLLMGLSGRVFLCSVSTSSRVILSSNDTVLLLLPLVLLLFLLSMASPPLGWSVCWMISFCTAFKTDI